MNGWVVLAVAFLGGSLGSVAGCVTMYFLWSKFLKERIAADLMRRSDEITLKTIREQVVHNNGRAAPVAVVPAVPAQLPAAAVATEEKAPGT